MDQKPETLHSKTVVEIPMTTFHPSSGKLTLIAFLILILWPFLLVYAQAENKLIRKGNQYYNDQNFKEAEIEYRKSLDKNEASVPGRYNLGTSLYKQKNHQEAVLSFDSVLNTYPDEKIQAQTYYNLGNSLLKFSADSAGARSDALQGSIEAYKQSLRLNPHDSDARYNLAYAQRLLQQQQKQQQNQNQDQQQKDQQQKDQQQKDQQQQSRDISRQDAERMLEALKNDEKQTLEKLKKQQVRNQRTTFEKDW